MHAAPMRTSAWAERLGAPRGRYALRYGVSGLIRATATGLFYPFSLLYFHRQLDAPLTHIGVGLTVAGLVGAVGVAWTGPLVDRVGARAVLVTAALTRMTIFALYPFVHSLGVFVALAGVMALAYRTDQVAGQAIVNGLAPAAERPSWLALSRMTLNAGIGLGALLAGVVLVSPDRYTWLVVANAVAFAAVAALSMTLPRTEVRTEARSSTTAVWHDRLFVVISSVSGLWLVIGLAVEVGLPVYLVLHLDQSPGLVGVVFLLNTSLVTLLQLPLARRVRDRPAMRTFAWGLATYAVSFLLLLSTRQASGGLLIASLIAAVCAFTVGEMLIAVTGMVLVNQLAPPGQVGVYVGASHLIAGLGSAAAPALFTGGLALSPGGLWLGLAVLALTMIGFSLLLQAPVTERINRSAPAYAA